MNSKQLPLVVKHRPVCAHGNTTQDLWTDLGQPLRITCDVTAVPAVDSWWWTLNTSRQLDKLSGEGGAALHYTPHTERDFGLLSCWAANAEGRMAAPCTFLLRRAAASATIGGRQEQEQLQHWTGLDCSLHNQTLTSLIVSCIWDGGLRKKGRAENGGRGPSVAEVGEQRFYYLEVREKEGGELVQNLTAGKEWRRKTTEPSYMKKYSFCER